MKLKSFDRNRTWTTVGIRWCFSRISMAGQKKKKRETTADPANYGIDLFGRHGRL